MITGYILAGGRSSRMGCDKAFLDLDGRPLIDAAIHRLRPHVGTIIVIGSQRNRSRLEELPVEGVLTDLQPDLGPLMGVYTGLMHSETALNLFVPCDMPWIAAAHVQQLLRAWVLGTSAVASRGCDDRVYPLPLLCHHQVTRTVGRLLSERQRSLTALLDAVAAHLVPVQSPELMRSFENLNTPEEYASVS